MKTSRLSKSKISVFCAVLVLHLVAAALLLKNLDREEPYEAFEEPLIVRWIQRTPRTAENSIQPAKNAASRGATRKLETEATSDIKDQTENHSDGHEHSQLVLSAPEPAISFERNPLEKHQQLEATPIQMKVNIVDRSFFGVLQRMTKTQICKDLRAALSKAVGDATTIMTTMQKEGCIRS